MATEETSRVLADVTAERERQDAKWGGPSHDDGHTPEEWYVLMGERAKKALDAFDADPDAYRRRMVEAVTLGVAALEAFDRWVVNTQAQYAEWRAERGEG